jgi:hypothetical protein
MRVKSLVIAAALLTGVGVGVAGAQSSTTTAPESPQGQQALLALQQARNTIAELAESSMSHEAREAFDRLTMNFRALYAAYTGHDPDERKSTSQLAEARHAPGNWRAGYTAVTSSIQQMLGPESTSTDRSKPVGTSGRMQATGGMPDLSEPVRDELRALRTQLQRFETAAGDSHARSNTPKK